MTPGDQNKRTDSRWLNRRSYTRGEKISDAVVHVLGIAAGLSFAVTLGILAIPNLPGGTVAALMIYAFGMVAMLGLSAAYNMVPESAGTIKEALRRLDHSAIFIMIAGTYTPLAAIIIGGVWGAGLLIFVWTIAVVGVTLKLVAPRRLERVSLALYLLQGWAVIVAIGPLVTAMPMVPLILLAAGGVLYSVGVIFHVWDGLPYQNTIWHAFVLAAVICHFIAMVDAVALAPPPA